MACIILSIKCIFLLKICYLCSVTRNMLLNITFGHTSSFKSWSVIWGHFWLTCISNVSLWNGESIGLAVSRTFSTNHLSYTKTLVPIYIFRAITFFDGAAISLEKMAFLPQNKKNFVVSSFSRNLNCSSSISRYVLGYIWGLD